MTKFRNFLNGETLELKIPLSMALLFMTLLYVFSHISNLSRELVFEEYTLVEPGRNLILGEGYVSSLGPLKPVYPPFHKPPLTMLMVGAASFLGPDPVAAARMVPFFTGLLFCLLPLILTRSLLPSVLILFSPFFYGCSSQLQTDPTAAGLGYALFCAGVWLWLKEGISPLAKTLTVIGWLVLWMAKLESLAFAAISLSGGLMFCPQLERRRIIKTMLAASVAGIMIFIFINAYLGATAGFHLSDSVFAIPRVIQDTVMNKLSGQVKNPSGGIYDRVELLKSLYQMKILHIGLLLLIPVIILPLQRRFNLSPDFLFLLLASAFPALAYLGLGYLGDRFPRYYLLSLIPLSILCGQAMAHLPLKKSRTLATIIIIAGVLFLLPQTLKSIASPGSPSVWAGSWGLREAGTLVRHRTSPESFVVCPEAALYYVSPDIAHKRGLSSELVNDKSCIDPYLSNISALIVARSSVESPHRYDGPLGFLIQDMESRGATSSVIGTYEVLILPDHSSHPASH